MYDIFQWRSTSTIDFSVLPVSIAEVKQRMLDVKIIDLTSNTSIDSYLTSLIKSSVKLFEEQTNHMIYPRTLCGNVFNNENCFEFSGYYLKKRNIKSIDSIKYYQYDWNQDSSANKESLVINDFYNIIPESNITNTTLRKKVGVDFPIVYQKMDTIEINITCGYDIVNSAFVGIPDDIKSFIIYHVTKMYSNQINDCDCSPTECLINDNYLLQIISSYSVQEIPYILSYI